MLILWRSTTNSVWSSSSTAWLSLFFGTKSPNPIVDKVMKQKQMELRKSHCCLWMNMKAPPKRMPNISKRQIQIGMGLVISTSSQSSYSNSCSNSPPVVLILGVETPLVGVDTQKIRHCPVRMSSSPTLERSQLLELESFLFRGSSGSVKDLVLLVLLVLLNFSSFCC